jgi:transglutaminase-like putative cysteine protease
MPRRPVPVPPPKPVNPISNTPDSETLQVQSLAARIALLGLNAGNTLPTPPSRAPPQMPPRSRTVTGADVEVISASDAPDLAKLLARRPPPPPPARRKSALDSTDFSSEIPPPVKLPPRRLPPVFVPDEHASPIPPPVNLASRPVLQAPRDVAEFNEASFDHPSCIQCRDFSGVDAHAALFPRHTIHSLEYLASALTEPFEDDVDKARALYTWLHRNIIYDVESFLSGNIQAATPESTLSSGLAVCDGYAGLFEYLATLVGLQAHKVTGHGKGYGYHSLSEGDPIPEQTMNHAWNCVYLGEEWHLIDSCWGAGALNGTVWEVKLNPTWFIASSLEFGRRHFPDDPSYQLTEEQSTWEEYIMAPEGPKLTPEFTEFGLHPLLIEPATGDILEKRYTKFSVCKRCEHMSTSEADNYVFVLTTSDKEFTPVTYNNEEGAWIATIFTPRNGTVLLCIVDTVNQQDARGLGVAGFTKAKGRKAMSFKSLASWTIMHL